MIARSSVLIYLLILRPVSIRRLVVGLNCCIELIMGFFTDLLAVAQVLNIDAFTELKWLSLCLAEAKQTHTWLLHSDSTRLGSSGVS